MCVKLQMFDMCHPTQVQPAQKWAFLPLLLLAEVKCIMGYLAAPSPHSSYLMGRAATRLGGHDRSTSGRNSRRILNGPVCEFHTVAQSVESES